jgi:hypothetical protein
MLSQLSVAGVKLEGAKPKNPDSWRRLHKRIQSITPNEPQRPRVMAAEAISNQCASSRCLFFSLV